MAINYTALPGSRPNNIIPKACYLARIEIAEMKTPKQEGKKDYLNLRYALQTPEGKNVGKIYDILSESEQPLMQFKLQRFIQALELPITGVFELKDLVKMVLNKQLLVDVCPERKDGQDTGRNVVDVSAADIYYNIAEASRVLNGVTLPASDNRINAPDAEDAGEEADSY